MSISRIGFVFIALTLIVSFTGCSSSVSNPVNPGLEIESTDIPRDLECFNPDIDIEVTPANMPFIINKNLGGLADYHVKITNNETFEIFPVKGWIVGVTSSGKQYWPDKKYIPDPIQLFFTPNQEFHYDLAFDVPPDLPVGLYMVKVNIGFYLTPVINYVYDWDYFIVMITP